MADVLTRNLLMALSSAPETAFNTLYTLTGDYAQALQTQSFSVQLPALEKQYDENLIGSGREFATDAVNDWITNPRLTVSDRVNPNMLALLVTRLMSATPNTTAGSGGDAGSYTHVVKMMLSSADPQLKSSTAAVQFGAVKLLLGGMVVNSLGMEFAGGAPTTFNAELVGSGKFQTLPGPYTFPAVAAQNYMCSQAGATLTLNDGTLFDLAGRVRSASFSVSNNVITDDRRLGDGLLTAGDPASGAYVTRLTRGDRTATARLSLFADSASAREWTDHLNGTIINDLTYTAIGKQIALTTKKFQTKILFPRSIISVVNAEDFSPKLGLTLEFRPLLKTGEPGIVQFEFINDQATLA